MNIENIKEKISGIRKKITLYGGISTATESDVIDNDLAIYFDVITDHSISITNNITDNYLENNTAIQDTIAHAPLECSINGMIGELVYIPSTNNPRYLRRIYEDINSKLHAREILGSQIDGEYSNYVATDKLSTLGQLLPPVDNVTQLAKNAVVYVEDSIDRYKKIYKNLKRNLKEQTRLQTVYETLKKLSDTNTSLIVTTPFQTLYNMYIQNIDFDQGNENHTANISISLKQLNFTVINITDPDQNVISKYSKEAQAQVENNGKADGIMSKDSGIGDMIHKFSGSENYKVWQDYIRK